MLVSSFSDQSKVAVDDYASLREAVYSLPVESVAWLGSVHNVPHFVWPAGIVRLNAFMNNWHESRKTLLQKIMKPGHQLTPQEYRKITFVTLLSEKHESSSESSAQLMMTNQASVVFVGSLMHESYLFMLDDPRFVGFIPGGGIRVSSGYVDYLRNPNIPASPFVSALHLGIAEFSYAWSMRATYENVFLTSYEIAALDLLAHWTLSGVVDIAVLKRRVAGYLIGKYLGMGYHAEDYSSEYIQQTFNAVRDCALELSVNWTGVMRGYDTVEVHDDVDSSK